MSPHDLQPLAALLLAHPEQVAAVFAVLAVNDPCDGRPAEGIALDVSRYASTVAIDVELAGQIAEAGFGAGLLHRYTYRGEHEYRLDKANRFAIARGGVEAWLRERVTQP